jgi:hypothetical protein
VTNDINAESEKERDVKFNLHYDIKTFRRRRRKRSNSIQQLQRERERKRDLKKANVHREKLFSVKSRCLQLGKSRQAIPNHFLFVREKEREGQC